MSTTTLLLSCYVRKTWQLIMTTHITANLTNQAQNNLIQFTLFYFFSNNIIVFNTCVGEVKIKNPCLLPGKNVAEVYYSRAVLRAYQDPFSLTFPLSQGIHLATCTVLPYQPDRLLYFSQVIRIFVVQNIENPITFHCENKCCKVLYVPDSMIIPAILSSASQQVISILPQTMARLQIFNIKVNFYSYSNKTDFHVKGLPTGSKLASF